MGLLGSVAQAESGPARATADRVAVRFYSPETGGSTRPRFITERMLAFEARLEAMTEGSPEDAYEERYVRAAMECHIAEDMLANLMVERGSEPQDLPKLTDDFRRAITDRVGGAAALLAAAAREGIDETEIVDIMRRKVRAAYYVDRAIVPILHPSDEELREAHRTSNHPYKGMKFEDAEQPLRRWMIVERLRISEVAFLQASRSRVRIVPVAR
jgi:hypothetical protein